MLITCVSNFKFKGFSHKKIFKIYQQRWFLEIISQLHMLVDFKYLFVGKSFEFEIRYEYYQHRHDVMEKIS